jgi:hypothetical protein
MRVPNSMPLGCSLLLPVDTVNFVETLKALKKQNYDLENVVYYQGTVLGFKPWILPC